MQALFMGVAVAASYLATCSNGLQSTVDPTSMSAKRCASAICTRYDARIPASACNKVLSGFMTCASDGSPASVRSGIVNSIQPT